MTPVLKYRSALKSLPRPGGEGCHAALLKVANLARNAGLPEAQAVLEIWRAVPEGGRAVPESEVSQAVRRAYADKGGSYTPPARPAGPAVNWDTYRQKLIARCAGATDADLWELSPIRPDWGPGPRDAAETLRALYRPEEYLFIGARTETAVRPVKEWLPILEAGRTGEHLAPNPMTGTPAPTKAGGLSCRADSAVSAFRFAVCECDTLPRPDQIALWAAIIGARLLPVAALVDSAGKSLHAWLRVDLPDVAAWDAQIRCAYAPGGMLRGLGFDPACANPGRLSRLPGHLRADKGRLQRLLYLNPNLKDSHEETN